MSNTFTTATIGCEKCGGLICITPDQLVEGLGPICPLCGDVQSFDKEKLEAINADLADIAKAMEQKRK